MLFSLISILLFFLREQVNRDIVMVGLIESCGHFTPIMRSSLSTHAVLCSRLRLFPEVSCLLKLQFQMVWNFSFPCLKLLVSLLETRVSPIWNLCFPRMKLIPCLHPRISLSLSVYFRSFFFSFQPPLSHERPLSVCGNLFPKKWQYAHMLFLLSPCYHLYYHLVVTLNPLINNCLTWKVTSDNRKTIFHESFFSAFSPSILSSWMTHRYPSLPSCWNLFPSRPHPRVWI